MNYHQSDPVDHARTFRRHAGESVTYGANAPGLAGAAVAMVAVVVGLFALATEHVPAGTVAVILGAVLGVVSAAWLAHTHRKVREAELRWHAEHSDEPAPPSTS